MVPSRIIVSEVEAGCPEVEEIGICELGIKDKLFDVRDCGRVNEQVRR
jgi:hypothetical protein